MVSSGQQQHTVSQPATKARQKSTHVCTIVNLKGQFNKVQLPHSATSTTADVLWLKATDLITTLQNEGKVHDISSCVQAQDLKVEAKIP